MMIQPESTPAHPQFHVRDYDVSPVPVYVDTTAPFLFVLLEGEITVAYDSVPALTLNPGDSIMVMRHSCYRITVNRPSSGMIIVHSEQLSERLHAAFGNPSDVLPRNYELRLRPLPGVPAIVDYLRGVRTALADGEISAALASLWTDLLVELIARYHDPVRVAEFLYPVMAGDYTFRRTVIEHSLKVKGLPELASMCSMSLSTFKRRFKRTFHSPAHTWIAARKAHYIYSEIVNTRKTFVEIAEQFNISSSAYLTAFCKQHFGITPQEIRRRGRINTRIGETHLRPATP